MIIQISPDELAHISGQFLNGFWPHKVARFIASGNCARQVKCGDRARLKARLIACRGERSVQPHVKGHPPPHTHAMARCWDPKSDILDQKCGTFLNRGWRKKQEAVMWKHKAESWIHFIPGADSVFGRTGKNRLRTECCNGYQPCGQKNEFLPKSWGFCRNAKVKGADLPFLFLMGHSKPRTRCLRDCRQFTTCRCVFKPSHQWCRGVCMEPKEFSKSP